jgi:hypothetical protein
MRGLVSKPSFDTLKQYVIAVSSWAFMKILTCLLFLLSLLLLPHSGYTVPFFLPSSPSSFLELCERPHISNGV